MHRLDSGHFAVEDCLDVISENMTRFYDEKVRVGAKSGRTVTQAWRGAKPETRLQSG